MKVLLVAFLSLAAVAYADEEHRVRCNTGTRIQVEGFTAFDSAFPSFCASGQEHCVVYSYQQRVVDNGTNYEISAEFGECSDTPRDDCSNIRPFIDAIGEVTSCSASTCDGSNTPCNDFTFARSNNDCSVPEGEVRAFPGCTLGNAIQGLFDCATPFLFNFPYNQEEECHDHLNEMIQCVTEKVGTCLDSNCPSMFDGISGFRSTFSEISFWASHVKNADQLVDVVSNYTGGEFDMRQIINNFICSVDRTRVFDLIQELSDDRFDIDGMVGVLFPTFDCPNVFGNLQSAGFQFLRNFYNAGSQEEVHRYFAESVQNIAGVFQDCNVEQLIVEAGDVFESVNFTLPDEQLQIAFNVVRDFASFSPRPQPEGCPAEGPGEFGQIHLDCERYHNLTSRCGRRKAWACNFAEWRFNFLRTWLHEFYERHGDEQIPTPTCGNDADFISCRNSSLCCYEAPRGCRVCYCTEHDYENSYQDIYSSWRQSYRDWSQFFRAYQNFSRNSDTCF